MNRARAIAETVHLTALGIWLGSIGIAGAVAAVAFPTMRELDPTLGAYAVYPGDHWPIAAGEVLFKVFQISDFIAIVCVVLIGGSLLGAIAIGGLSMRRLSVRLRLALTLVMILVQAWAMFVLMPRMVGNVSEFWAAAKVGDEQRAGEYRVLFNNDHPTSRRVSETIVVFILVSMVTTGASMTDSKKKETTP